MTQDPVEDAVQVGGKDDRLLSWDQVEHIASISRSTAWRMERDGLFPGRVRISAGRVGWWESELTAWKRSRHDPLPAAPSRKPARAPRLPGMARSMPAPKTVSAPAVAASPITEASPASQHHGPEPVRPARPRGRRSGASVNQIDFGF
ncbi:MAG: AlpA family phage regulatory protein [Caulobacterales bacterium]|nr:AlpA family phage regulatory protein [Caulobacterales bacterium]